MKDLILQSDIVGKSLGELPEMFGQDCAQQGLRLTVKVVFRCKKVGKRNLIATYESGRRENTFNLAGGGCVRLPVVKGLAREFDQETPELYYTMAQLKSALVLAHGVIPTARKGYRGKYLVLVQLLIKPAHFTEAHLQPDGDELKDLKMGTVADAGLRLRSCTATRPEAASLYREAWGKLRSQL